MCVFRAVRERPCCWTSRPTHTQTRTHTEQYQTGSIRHLYLTLSGTLLSGLMQTGQMQLSLSSLCNRKCTTVDREPVWQPCVVKVVSHEGLIECHRKSPPSVKLARFSLLVGELRTVLSFYSFIHRI